MSATLLPELLREAVRNNVVWCDAVCRAQGLRTRADAQLWRCLDPPPPFYPSAVTVGDASTAAAQQIALRELVDEGLSAGWSIKDSYAALDLAPLGFGLLFDATWIALPGAQPQAAAANAELRWVTVDDAANLAAWEAAWRGEPANTTPAAGRIFRPALLGNPAIRFVAGLRGDAVIAGAIANRSGDVVGISNVFVPEQAGAVIGADCVAAVRALFPGLPLVGYEADADLAAFQALGFVALGPLRVWLRPGDG